MAASNYSVNIKLNTKPARTQLEALERRVNRLRGNLNKPLRIESKAVTLQKQQAQLQDRKFATMKVTARLGNQVRRLDEQGVKVDKLRLEIKNASRHLDKGRIETARSANKFVADELKIIEKKLQAETNLAGVDRQRLRDLNLIIGKKRVELSLIRTAGKFAAFNDRQRKGIGPNNLLALPSTEALKPGSRGISMLDRDARNLSTGFSAARYGPQPLKGSVAAGVTGFTAAQYGPQMLPTRGAGQMGMSINTRASQQAKRLRFQHQLNMLEAKGVKTTKLRAKMGELVDAQNRKQFGSIQRINNELTNGITKEQNKLKLIQEQNKATRQIADGKFAKGSNFGQIGGSIGPALPPRGSGGGRGFDIGSALISGGFPLLFGQGPFVGAAGALGGGIGGMFGQMGGFAGGIAATTVATTIQAFTVETGKLGAALNDATKDVEAVSGALGITGTEFEKNLKTLQKLGGEEAAFEAARQQMINLVGQEGVTALQNFGKGVTDIGNEFTKSMTMMRSSLAEFIGSLGIFQRLTNSLTNVNLRAQAERSKDPKVQALVKELSVAEGLEAAEGRVLSGVLGFGKKLGINKGRPAEVVSKELLDLQKSINLENERKAINKILGNTQEQRVKKISDEIALLERSFGLSADEFEIEKQILQMKEEGGVEDEKEIKNKLKYLQDLQKERQLAEETAAAFERMSQTIATDLSQGIQGMIRGTSTLNDMLNNVLNKLIDAAFNMAMFGNMQGTLGNGGLFGSILGGLGGLFGGGGRTVSGPVGPPVPQLASGGFAKGGKPHIVGERGPELFTPGVSGMVTPNHALGGSTNVVVNVDASGSSVEGDAEQGRELGRMISVAIQSELVKQKRPGGILA